MGLLINGVWSDQWYDTSKTKGEFIRTKSQFRNWITPNGSPGPSGEGGFLPKAGRYHLYVSLACPWAHRTLIFRKLKSLNDIIPISVVHPHMLDKGWTFEDWNGQTKDALYGYKYLHQLYTKANPEYSGRVTVPILWDTERETIVSNESSEIIRMFNFVFNDLTKNKIDYYPKELRKNIDSINSNIYESLNNGVYQSGFATTQIAYENAFRKLFVCIGELEKILGNQRFLIGNTITEADWRLFTTLIRFDLVYYSHFKTNLRRIIDYPELYGYTCDLYQHSGIKETIDFEHIKHHYYYSHETINPSRVVPVGPEITFDFSHKRNERFS